MNRKAMPEHELTKTPSHSATARLLDTETPKLKRAQPLNKPNSMIRDFLKHVGLQLPNYAVGTAFSWRSPEEHPKIAAYQSRRMAALNSFSHLIPLCAALVLLVLFWTSYWVGGVSDNGTSLQFAAKVHELLMQASLIDVLLHVIRFQATSGYIPLGALSGAARAPQLSYLWSLDFLSAVVSPTSAYSTQRKVAFVLSASGLLLMTAVVGPSSAVLMIPRPDMPYVNGTVTRYMNMSESSLFPTQIDGNVTKLNITKFDGFEQSRPLESTFTDDGRQITKYSWRNDDTAIGLGDMPSSIRTAYVTAGESNFTWAVATIPTFLSTRLLILNSPLRHMQLLSQYNRDLVARLKFAHSMWTTYTSHPVVKVRCLYLPQIENVTDGYYLRDDGSQDLLPNATGLSRAYLSKFLSESGAIAGYDAIPPFWMLSPEGSQSLLALYLVGPMPDNLKVCTITAFWHKKLTIMVPVDMEPMIQIPESIASDTQSDMTEIALDIDSVSLLAAPCQNNHISPEPLALCLADALSRIPAHQNATRNELFRDNQFDKTREVYPGSPLNGSSQPSKFEIIETIHGYGYGETDLSIHLSVAVMIAYCLVTIIYVTYIVTTGHTSVAWDSATELIVLALQSKELKRPRHVSVGLDSMKTFQQGVGIRVSTTDDDGAGVPREKLELIFRENEEAKDRGLTKVEPGTAY